MRVDADVAHQVARFLELLGAVGTLVPADAVYLPQGTIKYKDTFLTQRCTIHELNKHFSLHPTFPGAITMYLLIILVGAYGHVITVFINIP